MREGRRARSRQRSQATERHNPYVGPRAFEENESEFFFGRNEEIEILSGLVMSRRVALLFAQSGAGKSSLLRAGLIPYLTHQEEIGRGRRARTYQKMGVFPILSVGGGIPNQMNRPIANIYTFSALFSLYHAIDPNDLADLTLTEGLATFFPAQTKPEAEAAGGGKPITLKKPAHINLPSDTPILLAFDQFEELFTQHLTRWPERETFFQQISEALDTYPDLHVLFSMREDYLAELTPYINLLPEQLRPRFRLERLQRHTALQAVTKPAVKAGRAFDDGVAEELVDNLRRTQSGQISSPQAAMPQAEVRQPQAETLSLYVEPVHLQIVCSQLWDNLPPGEVLIVAKDVKDFSNVDQALTDFYESAIANVAKQTGISERRIRNWFDTSLITQAHTRNLVYRGETETEGLPNRAVDLLSDAYIIRASIRGKDIWYELAHDRMVTPIWTANRTWQATYYNPLATAYQEWLNSGQTPQKLLRGSQLKEAEEFAAKHPEDVLEIERNFLNGSKRYLNPLALATQAWLGAERDPSRLLKGSLLAEIKAYTEEHADEATAEEKEFLAESIRQEEAEREAYRQRIRRWRIIIVVGICILTLLVALTVLALSYATEATDARAEADAHAAEALQNARLATEREAEANQQKKTAEAASILAIQQQETAEAASTLAIQQQQTAEAASIVAMQQQETAEAERISAVEAREELAANLKALLATVQAIPTATETPLPTPTATMPPNSRPTREPPPAAPPSPPPTPTADLAATKSVVEIQTRLVEVEATQTAAALERTMVKVPGGTFKMGSLENSTGLPGLDRNPEPERDEFPQRDVFLPTFWIDRTEVSNEAYRECVDAGVCKRQREGDPNYHNQPMFNNYPVIFVAWNDANDYCQWRGKRLPTEAEWEKAARGTDGRIWPWGNRLQDDVTQPVQRANVADANLDGIKEVDSFPNGASPYGALNMTGNVWEWVEDWYKFSYYSDRPNPDRSPPGPPRDDSTERKVIRGGSYRELGINARTAERNGIPLGPTFDVGFRCARSDNGP